MPCCARMGTWPGARFTLVWVASGVVLWDLMTPMGLILWSLSDAILADVMGWVNVVEI